MTDTDLDIITHSDETLRAYVNASLQRGILERYTKL
jgi:hypothetical protein